MLESYQCDHCFASSQHTPLAQGQSLTRPFLSYRGHVRASNRRASHGPTRCAGLSQQGIYSLNANSSPPATVLQSEQWQCGPSSSFQRSAQAKHRDVRAHIRAPAIPALESQPHREGTDKTSQLQAGKITNIAWLHVAALAAAAWLIRWLSDPIAKSMGMSQPRDVSR